MKTKDPLFRAILSVAFAIFASSSIAATSWTEIGLTEDKVAKIFIADEFSTLSGSFNAVSYSGFADEESLTGQFVVGAFLFQHDTPTSQNGVRFDGVVTELALDCKRFFSATLKETYYLDKELIQTVEVPKAEQLMIQLQPRGTKIENAICKLYNESKALASGQ